MNEYSNIAWIGLAITLIWIVYLYRRIRYEHRRAKKIMRHYRR